MCVVASECRDDHILDLPARFARQLRSMYLVLAEAAVLHNAGRYFWQSSSIYISKIGNLVLLYVQTFILAH